MTSINLLPWREALKKERQQRFIAGLIAAAVFMVLVIAVVHLQYSILIDSQNARNLFLEQQIARVDKQIAEIEKLETEKQKLLARMQVIQKLQQGRPQIVHVFNEIVSTLPEGVYLTSMKQSSEGLVLDGFAQSNARVSAFMRNLDRSPWFDRPKLTVIEATTDPKKTAADRQSKFSLNVELVEVSDKENAQGG